MCECTHAQRGPRGGRMCACVREWVGQIRATTVMGKSCSGISNGGLLQSCSRECIIPAALKLAEFG